MNKKVNGAAVVDYSKELELNTMPEGVRAFIKERGIPQDQEFKSHLYRLQKAPGQTKARRYFLEKLENDFFEDDFGEEYIQNKYGGGDYQVIVNWTGADGKHGVQLEPLHIYGPEKMSATESVKDSQNAPPAAAPPQQNAAGLDLQKILTMLPQVTAAVIALKELLPKPDYSFIEKIAESQIKSMDKFNQQIQKMKMDQLVKQIEKAETMESETMEENSGVQWPEWLKPFSPLIEQFGEKLLGSGPVASTLRNTVINSDVFQNNWADPVKRAEARDSLSDYFGEDIAEALENTFNSYFEE